MSLIINNQIITGPIVPVKAENIQFYFNDTETRMKYSGDPRIKPVEVKMINFGIVFINLGIDRITERWLIQATKIKLFERFKLAVSSLVAFNQIEIKTDNGGRTFGSPIWNGKIPYGISAKHMNADLKRIGF